jgi:hypothetical protein
MIDPKSNYFQHGDVLGHRMDALPAGLKPVKPRGGRHILAEGETTNHAHAICDLDNCDVFAAEDGTLYMTVKSPVEITHEEHKAQTIAPGNYKIGRVREADPFSESVRQVRD